MPEGTRLLLQLAAAVIAAVVPMAAPAISWTIALPLLVLSAGLVAYAVYGMRHAALASWQAWVPQVTGIIIIAMVVIWIDKRPGNIQWPGWVALTLFGILGAGLVASIFDNLVQNDKAATSSPLHFCQRPTEYESFGGRPGATEIMVVVENRSASTIRDVGVRLLRLRQIRLPGDRGGSLAFTGLPKGLVGADDKYLTDLPPGCETAFRLIKRMWCEDETSEALLLPLVSGQHKAILPDGPYELTLKAFGRDVPPREGRYFVDVMGTGLGYKLLTESDTDETLLKGRIRITSTITVKERESK